MGELFGIHFPRICIPFSLCVVVSVSIAAAIAADVAVVVAVAIAVALAIATTVAVAAGSTDGTKAAETFMVIPGTFPFSWSVFYHQKP